MGQSLSNDINVDLVVVALLITDCYDRSERDTIPFRRIIAKLLRVLDIKF